MIGYLKGKLIYSNNGVVILDVNGVGYEITCSTSAFDYLTVNGGEEIFTYMAVKEDGVSLYGFVSISEKEMFLKLISVSGVGPKMGITVLSNLSLNQLAVSIASNDVKTLSSVKGLGKKTAERIILELREKISAEGLTATEPLAKTKETQVELDQTQQDAVIALMSLGFKKNECINAITKAKELGATDLKQMIAVALKNIR